jgi:putative flavoprotein involved in K+ transport
MEGNHGAERYETVIIGGGQAGLATGYHLGRLGRSFVILEADRRIGDAWRRRWDSLHLFTPARHDGLPGWKFPAPSWSFPSRDDMADYLEAYAARFDLPVRTSTPVDRVAGSGDGGYVVTAAGRRFEADNVVDATGAYQVPTIPAFASRLDPGIVQLHSSDYRRPSQLREGGVLVVGAGNSGAEIAIESTGAPGVAGGAGDGQHPVPHRWPGVAAAAVPAGPARPVPPRVDGEHTDGQEDARTDGLARHAADPH